jgi:hypothetical protein
LSSYLCKETEIKKNRVLPDQPRRKWDPISKITRAKREEGMAQALKHLPRKHKALSLNSTRKI